MRKGRLEQKYKQDKARLFEPWSSIAIQRIRDTEEKRKNDKREKRKRKTKRMQVNEMQNVGRRLYLCIDR